ncbi:YbdK family carboxylate-amine ligase [Pseudomonas sp. BN411]|uniref:YbdK family carboxylate-amine ligase n=1 Tax=Pseudomonas sp. BN411 TaxID=2567887 RepID=UPI002458CD93|nr:YbdK family carboxylate-amine ligase [Pseudomonas sp. BN411]MDH4563670.1 YbdK family carboxylate-amine ligase [Pseudomonas sp. BN411]
MPNDHLAPGFGVEETFFLVDRRSRNLPAQLPDGFLQAARNAFKEGFSQEMFQSLVRLDMVQPSLLEIAEARASLLERRTRLAAVAREYELAPVCAGTHPFADWHSQVPSDDPHNQSCFEDHRMIAHRSLACGLRVQVVVPEHVDRILVMNRVLDWLPLLLALSTSSPLWGGRPTGLMSYRQALCAEWPHKGIPEHFPDEPAFAAYMQWLMASGSIRRESDLSWRIRPCPRFPALELLGVDACPSVEDALCVASLFRALVAWSMDRTEDAPRDPLLQRLILKENHWRAMRFGIHGLFLDASGEASLSAGAWLARAHACFGALAEAEGDGLAFTRGRHILRYGSSADRQLLRYREALQAGLPRQQALVSVVDGLIAETCGD